MFGGNQIAPYHPGDNASPVRVTGHAQNVLFQELEVGVVGGVAVGNSDVTYNEYFVSIFGGLGKRLGRNQVRCLVRCLVR